MFCPNCGKDCGDANFCASCGTKVQQVVESVSKPSEWRVGIPCPHCGGMKMEGNKCAFCGSLLIQNNLHISDTEAVHYELPYDKYIGVSSSLTLYASELVVENRVFFKKYVTRMRYDQLVAVRLYRGTPDCMTFRWSGNRELPMPVDKEVCVDRTTVAIEDYLLFYHIFCALQTIAPRSTVFSIVETSEQTTNENIISTADLDWLFKCHSPFREPAVDDLRKRTGVKRKIAKLIIDKAFESRQKAIYQANPMAAMKDLNRVVEKRRQEAEEAKRRMEEYSEEQIRMSMMADAIERKQRNQR